MLVPAVVAEVRAEQLDEPHAPLDQPAGDQALPAEDFASSGSIEAVELLRRLGLLGQVDQLRHGGLHAEGEFVVGDGGFEGVVVAAAVPWPSASSLRSRSRLAARVLVLSLPGGVMSATGCAAWLEERALIRGRQEAAAEAVEAAGRNHAAVEDDEPGQVAALAAQAVGDPRAHARPALQPDAGVQEVVRVGVLGEVRRPSSGRRPGRRHTWRRAGTGR